MTSSLAPDPGPGGLNSALTYNLPFDVNAGDVMITEPGGGLGDVIRFSAGTGAHLSTLVFYSATPGGSLADTGFPSANDAITASIVEGLNGTAVYTPNSSQPGFMFGQPTTYDFISDSPVPLPATLPLFATGLGAIGLLGWRRKRKAQAV
jgi:hypothetical protein